MKGKEGSTCKLRVLKHTGRSTLASHSFHAELKHAIAPTKHNRVAGVLQDLQFERVCSSVQVPNLSFFFSSTGPLPPCFFTLAGLVVSGNIKRPFGRDPLTRDWLTGVATGTDWNLGGA